MGFLLNSRVLIGCCAVFLVLTGNGCLSYRMLREVKGNPVAAPSKTLRIGSTSMQEALTVHGAPGRIVSLNGRDLFLYEQSVFVQNSIAFGIPLTDFAGSSVSFSGYTNLTRYDVLGLVFTPAGVLEDVVFEKGSQLPYLETLFKSKPEGESVPPP